MITRAGCFATGLEEEPVCLCACTPISCACVAPTHNGQPTSSSSCFSPEDPGQPGDSVLLSPPRVRQSVLECPRSQLIKLIAEPFITLISFQPCSQSTYVHMCTHTYGWSHICQQPSKIQLPLEKGISRCWQTRVLEAGIMAFSPLERPGQMEPFQWRTSSQCVVADHTRYVTSGPLWNDWHFMAIKHASAQDMIRLAHWWLWMWSDNSTACTGSWA